MTTVHPTPDVRSGAARSKYRDYSVRLGCDSKQTARLCPDGPGVMRLFYRVIRIPSRREFLVHIMPGATEKERAWVTRNLDILPGVFVEFEHMAAKWLCRRGGYYCWSMVLGYYLDDPTMQLELELMIDQGQDAIVG